MDEKRFEALYPANAHFSGIEKVANYIRGGNFSQVVGMPGVGKGIMLGCLAYNRAVRTEHFQENEKWHHFVMVNFAEIRRKPAIDVYKLIFLALIDSVHERKWQDAYNAIHPLLQEGLTYQDEVTLLQKLKKALEYLCLEKELTVVFLFEHFQSYLPSLTPEFFAQLASLKARLAYRFSIIFSLMRPLEQLVDPEIYQDVYPLLAGHTIYMELYDKPGVDFRIAYLEKNMGKTLSPSIRKGIVQATSGHSKLTKVGTEEILTHHLSEAKLSAFLNENQAVRNVLYEIWHSLTPQEQTMLRKLALVSRHSHENEDQIPDQFGNDKAIQYLEAVHILRGGQFTIPLFADFVAYRATHLSDEKITYRAETNDILKGETVLTGRLTAAEFRLLVHFLQHPDRIIERDALVDVVWRETASTEGVTDQAIDQLLFRLRRKIEDAPDSPKHILTVKGRGIRFLP